MGCCNDPSVALTPSAPDPTQHVNYAKGMVLGVDDFNAEFAYLSGRDRWAVSELIGYGTTSGLAVTVEDTSDGPRVRVGRGAAAVPSGKLVCVPAEQCGLINKWLAKPENAQKVGALTGGSPPSVSPPSGSATIPLYLTLCYADCLTALVPIPGEPCRSDDELMAPSRVADSYKLDFRVAPPPQTEEDAVRDFVAWLRQVLIVDPSPPSHGNEASWIAALKGAAQPWFDALSASPPSSPPASFATLGDYMFSSPPPSLAIGTDQLGHFLRVAFRFWVEDLRPLWMTRICGAAAKPDDDCVLLAQLHVPVVWVGGVPTGTWQASGGAASISIDEGRRPYLAHMRLLQEWLLGGRGADALPSSPTFLGLTTTGAEQIAYAETAQNITLDDSQHVIVCTGSSTQQITLPPCAFRRGRVYILRSANAKTTLNCAPGDMIAGVGAPGPNAPINKGNALTVVSDGKGTWHVIATVA